MLLHKRGNMAILSDTTITIRVNSTTKQQAQALFNDLGLDLSTAVNIFLRKAVSEERIPFEISKVHRPNQKTRRAINSVKKGKRLSKKFNSVEEAMDYLDA